MKRQLFFPAVCFLFSLFGFSPAALGEDEDFTLRLQTFDVIPGNAAGEGTEFVIDDSAYANVRVRSTEPVVAMISSLSELVTLSLSPSASTAAASTVITIEGLLPDRVYYKYEDDLRNVETITTDGSGSAVFFQDISDSHYVSIQNRHSTKFIDSDVTGGDCQTFGDWDPATKTCTLTTDLAETIQISASGVTIDGNGHTISGAVRGIYLFNFPNYVTIRNLNIINTTYAIDLGRVYKYTAVGHHFTVENNTITDTNIGIATDCYTTSRAQDYLTIRNNRINTSRSNASGIYIDGTHYSSISSNQITSTNGTAIYLFGIYYSSVDGNRISESQRGIYFYACSSSSVTYNYIERSGYGFYSDYSWRYPSTAAYNTYYANGVAVFDFMSSYGTAVRHIQSNFIANTQDCGSFRYNPPISGSYYSKFDTPEEGCNDADGNYICDAAYNSCQGTYDSAARVIPVPEAPSPLSDAGLVANAGPDQVVECTRRYGADASLDGSGSYNPSGGDISLFWTVPGGIATGYSPTIPINFTPLTITLGVFDGEGHWAYDRMNITMTDTTPPSVIVDFNGAESRDGWFSTPSVDVTLTVQDTCIDLELLTYSIDDGPETSVSYVPSWTGTFTITGEGEHAIHYYARDRRSNVASGTIPVNIDTAPPVTSATITGVFVNGFYTGCVDVSISASGSPSGWIEYRLNNGEWTTYTLPFRICDEDTTNLDYRGVSSTGKREDTHAEPIVIDTAAPSTGPSISSVVGLNGWYISPVTITLTASDATSGVKETHLAVDGVDSLYTIPVTISGDGIRTVSYWSVDNAGNIEEAHTLTFCIDTVPPSVAITGIADGAEYVLGSVPQAGFTDPVDATSGVASLAESLTGGDGLGLGTFVYTVKAADKAGNVSQVSATYTVIATASGTVDVLNGFVASGQVDSTSATPLSAQLDNAAASISNHDNCSGINELRAFILSVDAMYKAGHMTLGVRDTLVNAAQYIIATTEDSLCK